MWSYPEPTLGMKRPNGLLSPLSANHAAQYTNNFVRLSGNFEMSFQQAFFSSQLVAKCHLSTCEKTILTLEHLDKRTTDIPP